MTTPNIEPMTLAEFDAFRIGNKIPVIVGNYPRLRAALADRERMIDPGRRGTLGIDTKEQALVCLEDFKYYIRILRDTGILTNNESRYLHIDAQALANKLSAAAVETKIPN